jgi:hypothetical protein
VFSSTTSAASASASAASGAGADPGTPCADFGGGVLFFFHFGTAGVGRLLFRRSLTPSLVRWMQRDLASSRIVIGFVGSRRPWSIHS